MKKLLPSIVTGISAIGFCSLPALAQDYNGTPPQFACSIASDATAIRDYPTFRPVAKLERGECMEVVPDPSTSSPVKYVRYKGQTYYMVTGASGNLRVVSARYTELK